MGKMIVDSLKKELMTVQELAEYLKIRANHVRQLCFYRKIPFIRVGRLLRFEKGEIEEWLDRNKKKEGALEYMK